MSVWPEIMKPATAFVALISIVHLFVADARPTTESVIAPENEYPTEVSNIATYPPLVYEAEVTIPPEFAAEVRKEEDAKVEPIPVPVTNEPVQLEKIPVMTIQEIPTQERINDWDDGRLVRVKRFIPGFFSKIFLAKKFFVHHLLKAFTGFGMGLRPSFFG